MSENVGSGGKINEEGYTRHLYAMFKAGAQMGLSETAWKVIQRAAGANMSVDVQQGNGLIGISSSYLYPAWVASADKNVPVDAADPTNPRKDIVVAYIDLAAISTSLTNNTGALKFKAVAGTPAGSPSDPSAGTIQSAVGSGNPYFALARLAVSAADTSIVTADITDLRPPVNLRVPVGETIAAITATTVLSWGYDRIKATNAITITLPDATLNPGGKIKIWCNDTNLKTITTTSSQTINGSTNDYLNKQYDMVEYESDGTNWVITQERRSPTLAIATSTSNFATTSSSATLITGLSINPYVPAGSRKVTIECFSVDRAVVSGGTGTVDFMIWDGSVAGTLVARQALTSNGFTGWSAVRTTQITIAAGNGKTYVGGVDISGGFTITIPGSANLPSTIKAIMES